METEIAELKARIVQLEAKVRELEARPAAQNHYHYYPPVYQEPVSIPSVWQPGVPAMPYKITWTSSPLTTWMTSGNAAIPLPKGSNVC